MIEFFMDENENVIKEAATEQDLANWANNYQRKYFRGPEPTISIRINPGGSEGGCFKPKQQVVSIPHALTAFEKSCRIVLLHEMVHVNLASENGDPDPNHGLRFKSEIKRLIAQGAYDNLL